MRHGAAQPPGGQAGLLERLQRNGLLDPVTASRAMLASEKSGTTLEATILELGLVDEDRLFRALAEHVERPFVTLSDIDTGLLDALPLAADYLERVVAVPVRREGGQIVLAVSDPDCDDVVRSIEFHLGNGVLVAIASPSTIKAALARAAADGDGQAEAADYGAAADTDVERLRLVANHGPVVKLVNDMIGRALAAGASDVHIEPREFGARVRFRVDGVLQDQPDIPEDRRAAAISRIKVMANLNISEKRRPQDGRAEPSVRGRKVDIRVSTLPTRHGESVVLRLLDRSRLELDWRALGFSPERQRDIEALVAQPNGIFLVAGPTGAGKTTTLYAALAGLNTEDRKVITIEDPVEFALPGVNQTQVDPSIDMGFAEALRAILRQDPNVIMVGEIRDRETAEIAVRAALIGRMVLSTVHTNGSLAAIDRLYDLGVPPYLLAATLRGVLSQRLLRKVCPACEGHGGDCAQCGGTGSAGRTVVSELLAVSPELAEAIAAHAPAKTREDIALGSGFRTLADEARSLVARGIVSTEEVLRNLGSGYAGAD